MRLPRWLSDADYAWVRQHVPVPCVDLLPWRDAPVGREVGLITREVGVVHPGYALIGGRVLRDETLGAAIRRHVRETLGEAVRIGEVDTERPLGVFEYFPDGDGPLIDPNKHAVASTYAAPLEGEPVPQGEAVAFAWFPLDAVPPPERFASGHGKVVHQLLGALS